MQGQLPGMHVSERRVSLRGVVHAPSACADRRPGGARAGKWTVQQAAELSVAAPTIEAALDGRFLSGLKEERVAAAEVFAGLGAHAPKAVQARAPRGLPAPRAGRCQAGQRVSMRVLEARSRAKCGAAVRAYVCDVVVSDTVCRCAPGCETDSVQS